MYIPVLYTDFLENNKIKGLYFHYIDIEYIDLEEIVRFTRFEHQRKFS